MEFSLSDIFAVRDGFDGWEALSLIIENFVLIAVLLFVGAAIRTNNLYRRNRIIEGFVEFSSRPMGGPLTFPSKHGMTAAIAIWVMITYSALRVFELPVLGIVASGGVVLLSLALHRRSSLRRLYDDPFNDLANTGLKYESRYWWDY